MAHLDLEITHVLRVTEHEFRLIGLALSGKLPEAEAGDAAELNHKLLSLRAGQLGHKTKLNANALATSQGTPT